ncbi:MAG: KR domain-containing protein, partial [Verrucomicrobiota bacterium]
AVKNESCALTSTKTNFGHTFAASGLVSLISLVQALRHEIIPASLHCDEVNEYIPSDNNPFFVNREPKAWPARPDRPRIGGVSAFGMSGTNAHVLVEDVPARPDEAVSPASTFLLALSARTEEALTEKIKALIAFLENREPSRKDLVRIGYTLLDGRYHFQHRCAVVIDDAESAVYTLKQIGGEQRSNLFEGVAPREFTGQKVMEELIRTLLAEGSSPEVSPGRYQEILHALAEFYVQGYDIAWHRLYGEQPPRRISLPTYPFARNRYWAGTRQETAEDDVAYVSAWEVEALVKGDGGARADEVVLVARTPSTSSLRGRHALEIELSDDTDFESLLQDHERIDRFYFISSLKDGNGSGHALSLLRLIQALQKKNISLDAFIMTEDDGGVTGLAYALAQGDHRFRVRNLIIDSETSPETIENEPPTERGDAVRLQWGRRYVQTFRQLEWGTDRSGLRKGGVYVILGGSGAVGRAITRCLLDHYEATVIWIGRSSDPRTFERVDYMQADVTDLNAMRNAVKGLKEKHPVIHGAVFAGMVFDLENSIRQTSEAAFEAIFDVKARGSLHFYNAFKDEPLDFMCFFSSAQAFSFSGAS